MLWADRMGGLFRMIRETVWTRRTLSTVDAEDTDDGLTFCRVFGEARMNPRNESQAASDFFQSLRRA